MGWFVFFFHQNGMVKIMVPNPIRIHDLGGGSPICGNTQMDLEKKGGLVEVKVKIMCFLEVSEYKFVLEVLVCEKFSTVIAH